MKALILAAGLGSRLGLKDIPKPMYEIAGKPVLEHNLLLLKNHNVNDICINLHYLPEVIKNYFQDGNKWGVKIQYSYEKELLGTSGAVKNVKWFWNKEPFFVIYGDNFSEIDLTAMKDFHLTSKATVTIALFDPKKSLNSGIAGGYVSIDQNNKITSFTEGKKDKSCGYVNAGVYILELEILDMIPDKEFSDFGKDIFPKLIQGNHLLNGFITDSFVLAIDTVEAQKIADQSIIRKGIINDNN